MGLIRLRKQLISDAKAFLSWYHIYTVALTELLGFLVFFMLIKSLLIAFGDIYMTYVASKQPSHSKFEIESKGFIKVYL